MKNIAFLSVLFIVFPLLFGCEESAADKQKKAIEMMTTQTLGLAYLEEFKLEEAEKEFLKMISLVPDDKLGYANLGLVYLRMGKYKDAETQLLKAEKIDPDDADIKLLLSTVYQMDGRREEAKNILRKALESEPDHVKILYDLAELYSAENNKESKELRKRYLQDLVEYAPENIVPQLQLTEVLIEENSSDIAIARLQIMQRQFPEFPKEAKEYYEKTIEQLQNEANEKALISFTVFHNYMKVSYTYQSGINDLKGPGGSLIGFPLITYNRQVSNEMTGDRSVLEVIKFKDVTSSLGLDLGALESSDLEKYKNTTHIQTADYNGDGKTDFYIGNFDSAQNSYEHYLFSNTTEGYRNVSSQLGLNHKGKEIGASFADYDNDGFLDLYINLDQNSLLYRNADKGIFEDRSPNSKLYGGGVNKALFFDLDQDGDLDLFQVAREGNSIFRNNGDGSFDEIGKESGLSTEKNKNDIDAAFGDFDDDGDIDIITLNASGDILMYTNKRQGTFEMVADAGLEFVSGSSSLAIADYNNDGFLDVFIGSLDGENSMLYRNSGEGKFQAVAEMAKVFAGIQDLSVRDVAFLDFDNDGFQDVLLLGESKSKNASGLQLYHNDGTGMFSNSSEVLPLESYEGCELAVPDYDGDGDRDILLALSNGGVKLLRNDGGNMNHYVKMKLVGLRTGSAKNNYYGIGVKVEMRAGDLYQSMVVTDPDIYFGLGSRPKADVIRITWTNGVPQNILLPDTDQALIESQTLKGSCPFLYAWNGEKYEFVKDITWRSALGMPLGIMGGTTKYAFAAASDDYIKIDESQLKEKDGLYSIQVTSELWETIYLDQLELVAVDHPEEVAVFVPEQFGPPPFPGMKLYELTEKYAPLSAIDESGKNVLAMILAKDNQYLSHLIPGKFQGITKQHDLILDPGTAGQLEELHLFLRGWIFPTDASINVALSQSDSLKLEFPVIQVINEKGDWQQVDTEMSFPMGKDKTVIVDLRGKFLSQDHRIRIRTNMEIYWDEIFFADARVNDSLITNVMQVKNADLHYRGFSESYRKGGRYGPHWFDYSKVQDQGKWRDLTGRYTRYGDVTSLVRALDNQYIVSNSGDETSINFDATGLPVLKQGWKRDFLIHSVGWVKDGDFNTAEGHTVEPLPYHGMSSYPPAAKDRYPKDSILQQYHKEYNTRLVNHQTFRNSIKPN
ncbi:FG-GAP-like repeat-containing protein [Lutimonas sp.]|uniref:FG-GAP-like repeat-containing protein n=1 Tax=Lutimonas sp. TaxID=1872403 RepID=UPI003D9BDF60